MVFRGTQLHGNADGLSRLLLPSTTSDLPMAPELVLLLEHLTESPVTASDIKKFTRRGPVLSQVLQFVLQGWPIKCDTSLSAYSSRKTESSVLDGCLCGVQEWLFHHSVNRMFYRNCTLPIQA